MRSPPRVRHATFGFVLFCTLAIGCAGPHAAPDAADGMTRDALSSDAANDATSSDAGPQDQGIADAQTESGTTDAGPTPRLLILHDFHTGPAPTPAFIRDHQSFLDSLPFDGMTVYLRNPDLSNSVSSTLTTSGAISDATIAGVLAPLLGLHFASMQHNFAIVFTSVSGRPPDLFDDAGWSVVTQNFQNLARASREAGLEGILIDNEQYAPNTWADWTPSLGRSLQVYQDQARLRGRQLIAAMIAVFPSIAVITLHGPYVSEPQSPAPFFNGGVAAFNELLGPFFVGMVEGRGASATIVDGGELYTPRSAGDFDTAYQWEKFGLAFDTTNCAFIPSALRPLWPASVSVSTGLYDTPFQGVPMDPSIMQTTATNALRRMDRYVWLYTESVTFLVPPGGPMAASVEWVDAVRAGRDLAR